MLLSVPESFRAADWRDEPGFYSCGALSGGLAGSGLAGGGRVGERLSLPVSFSMMDTKITKNR